MTTKDKESDRRGGLKTRNVDDSLHTKGNDQSDKNYDQIVQTLSSHNDDSSHANGSELASEDSRYTTDDESVSVGSSLETNSYLSSILEEMDLGADTQELLENDELLSTLSYESKSGIVGGWLDLACGWMDKPNLCAVPLVLGGTNQTSLLRQSKAAKAIQRVKLSDTFKKAAGNVSASKDKNVERIQRDVAKAAAAAAESVRMQEIQPSELPAVEEERVEDRYPRKKESSRIPKSLEDQRDDDIEEKMKKVSARAAEILKNTVEARAKTPREEHDDSSPPKKLSHVDLRKKVFDQLERDRNTSSDDESIIAIEPSHDSNDDNQVVQVPETKQETTERSTRSMRSTHSVVAKEETDNTVPTGEIVHVEEIPAMANGTGEPEDDDIESENEMKESSLSSTPPEKQDSHDSANLDLATNHSITDLTHVGDDAGDDGDLKDDRNTKEPVEHKVHPQSPKSRRNASSKRSTRLAALHRNDLGKRDVEVIDVLEIDEEDAWIPSERRDHTPSRSNHASFRTSFLDKRSGDRSPVKSSQASLFGANVPNTEAQQELRRQQRAPRDAAFNDPRAREAFAGLRRGRIETNEKVYDRTSAQLNKRADSIIDAEVALRRGKNRESRQRADKSMNPRRNVAEATIASNVDQTWPTDSSSRRSSHLVVVRSIDEAQRLRNEQRARELQDSGIHTPRSREMPRESIKYGHLAPANLESPEVRQHMKSRTTADQELMGARSGRNSGYDSSRGEHHGSTGRQSAVPDQELYSSVIINRSKSREGPSDYMEGRDTDRYANGSTGRSGLLRGRDMRDDSDTKYAPGSDQSGYAPQEHYGESKSRRREKTSLRGESEQIKELRKLEKKISEQYSSQENAWDERSAVSVKQLRHLEKKYVQTLKDDEKRTDKLKRIQSKKPTRKPNMEGDGSMIAESMMSRNRSGSPEKGVDMQDARFKYNHLKVLRQSRQMHKYMQRTSSRTSARRSTAPRPEAF